MTLSLDMGIDQVVCSFLHYIKTLKVEFKHSALRSFGFYNGLLYWEEVFGFIGICKDYHATKI